MERAVELTLNQLSDTGDDEVLFRDALRDMIEVLVDDQVWHPLQRVACPARACCARACGDISRLQLSLGIRIGVEISRKRPDFQGSVSFRFLRIIRIRCADV